MRWRVAAAAVGAAVGLGGAFALGQSAVAAAVCMVFVGAMGVVAVVDLQERRIPNWLTYPGTLAGIVLAGLLGLDVSLEALLGALLAGGIMLVVFIIGRGKLGLGDVKLSVLVGAVVGVGGVPLYLVVGTGVGALASVVLLVTGADRRSTLAYGPYLAVGAVVAVLVDGPLVR